MTYVWVDKEAYCAYFDELMRKHPKVLFSLLKKFDLMLDETVKTIKLPKTPKINVQ